MRATLTAIAAGGAALTLAGSAYAQTPRVVDPKLEVVPVATQLTQPVQMEFIGDNDFFVLEKSTGIVKRVNNGVTSTALDLTVNSISERGLLGIALDRHFKFNGSVYLYWSETTLPADNTQGDAVPLLGNRLDRFHWDGTALTYEKTLHRNRALQDDASNRTNPSGPVFRGNHHVPRA